MTPCREINLYILDVESKTTAKHRVVRNICLVEENNGIFTVDKACVRDALPDAERVSSTLAFYALAKEKCRIQENPGEAVPVPAKLKLRMESHAALEFVSKCKAYAEHQIELKDVTQQPWVGLQEIAMLGPIAKFIAELNALGFTVVLEGLTSQHARSVKDQLVDMPWTVDPGAFELLITVSEAMSSACKESGMPRPDLVTKAGKTALTHQDRDFLVNTKDRKMTRFSTPEEARLVTSALAITTAEHSLVDEIEELQKEVAISRVYNKELEDKVAAQDGQPDAAQTKDLKERAERVMLLVHALENAISKRNDELMVCLSVDLTNLLPARTFEFPATSSTEHEESGATASVRIPEEGKVAPNANVAQTSADAAAPSPECDAHVTKAIEDDASLIIIPESGKVNKETLIQAAPAPSSLVVPAEATLPTVKSETVKVDKESADNTSAASSSSVAPANKAEVTLPTSAIVPLKRNAESMDTPVPYGSSSAGRDDGLTHDGDDSGSHQKRLRA